MPLFEVAIIKTPTKKEVEDGTGNEELILAPTPVVARDANMAAIAVVTKNPPEGFDPNRCTVLIRPFA
jgi:hypothetical protein